MDSELQSAITIGWSAVVVCAIAFIVRLAAPFWAWRKKYRVHVIFCLILALFMIACMSNRLIWILNVTPN